MKNPIFDALGGRKNFLTLVALFAVGLVYWQGDITSEQFLEFLKWGFGIGVAGHALEGGLNGLTKASNGDKKSK